MSFVLAFVFLLIAASVLGGIAAVLRQFFVAPEDDD